MTTSSPWRATVLTLFPEMFPGPLGVSLAGRALAGGLWELEARDIRASATDRHRSVDDTPAGGGPGMVLRADVLAAAIDAVEISPDRPKLLMSPRGRPLTQARVMELAEGPGPLIVCGRFEGVDQRVIDGRGLEEVSIGDYVLSGGEIAALALIDACVRLLPGVMGKEASGTEESFSEASSNTPNTPVRSCSRGPRSRKSSPRATTPRLPAGGGHNRRPSRRPGGLIYGPKSRPSPRIGPVAKKRQKTRQTGDKRSGLPYSSGQIRNGWIDEFRAAPV